MTGVQRICVAAVVVCAAVVTVVFGLNSWHGRHSPSATDGLGVRLPFTGSGAPAPPGQPCDGATLFKSLKDLQTATDVPLYLPQGKVPSRFWSCGSNPYVGYGNVEVNFQPGWAKVDPATKWAGMAEQSGGQVRTVLGQPAWVRPADNDGTWPLVEVIVNGTMVTVLGAADVPTHDVVALAESISVP